MGSVRLRWTQWKFNQEPRSSTGFPNESSTKSFDSLPHSPQSVAFYLMSTASVIVNFQQAIAIARRQTQFAIASLGVTHHISQRLTHNQCHHTFLNRGERDVDVLRLQGHSGGLKRGLSLFDLGLQTMSAIASDSASNLGQCGARGVFDITNF